MTAVVPRAGSRAVRPVVLLLASIVGGCGGGASAAAARATLPGLVEDRRGIDFKGTATPEQLTLDELTWLDPAVGVVPGDEKADPDNAIQQRTATP